MSIQDLQRRSQAMVAPAGMRVSGPGTRSKNPRAYDEHAKAKKAAEKK